MKLETTMTKKPNVLLLLQKMSDDCLVRDHDQPDDPNSLIFGISGNSLQKHNIIFAAEKSGRCNAGF